MASELIVVNTTGTTVYAAIRVPHKSNAGRWFDAVTGSFVAFVAGAWTTYAVAMTELGTTGLFEADMPAQAAAERELEVYYFQQTGGAPAMTDLKIGGSLFEMSDNWVATAALNV